MFLLVTATFFSFPFLLLFLINYLSTVSISYIGGEIKILGRLLSATGSRGRPRKRPHDLRGADQRAKVASFSPHTDYSHLLYLTAGPRIFLQYTRVQVICYQQFRWYLALKR